MYCGNCGAQLAQTARFCGHCGAPAPNQAMKPRPAATISQGSFSQSITEIAHETTRIINSGIEATKNTLAASTARVMSQRNASTDWAVTLDLDGSSALLKTGWFASEITFHIRPDGLIWFDTAPQDLFELIDFAWDGPNIEQETVTTGNHSSEKKGRLGGAVAAGAAAAGVARVFGGPVGGLAAGAVGAVVGAFVGNGNTEKSDKEVTKTETKERKSTADVTLRSVYTGQIGTVSISGKSRQFSPLIKLSKYVEG